MLDKVGEGRGYYVSRNIGSGLSLLRLPVGGAGEIVVQSLAFP
jgi:hypothetical protein